MVKGFKLRLSRVISSLHSCRSKDPSNLPESPVPAYFMLSPVNPKALDIDFPAPQPSKRQVSSSILSLACGCTSKHDNGTTASSPEEYQFRWKQEEKFHVVARVQQAEPTTTPPRRKLYNSSVSDESEGGVSPCDCDPPQKTKKKIKQRKKKKKKKNSKPRGRLSTSSAESGRFSSSEGGDENETETLFSSSNKTFSTDSNSTETRVNPRRVKKVRKLKASSSELCRESPARLSVLFQRLMPCKAEGKVKESFAVVKKSEDPYEDFKRSMLEMILAKQMFDTRDLEQLLHCFLSLNSRHHHPVIVQAFSDIWEILFCNSSVNPP